MVCHGLSWFVIILHLKTGVVVVVVVIVVVVVVVVVFFPGMIYCSFRTAPNYTLMSFYIPLFGNQTDITEHFG